tara:strand:+ start:512 stop:1132 length:621 start_codon:yes stop_codon:yes gene_type:complete
MLDVYPMFSVPLYRYRIPNWHANKQEIYDLIPDWDDEYFVENKSGTGLTDGDIYSDYWCKRGMKPPYTDAVFNLVHPFFIEFARDLDQRQVGIADIWCQTSYKGQKHNLHNHGFVGWSAILYVEFDPEVHDGTSFLSPFSKPHGGSLDQYVPEVEEGDLIVFPSTIPHESLENQSDRPRTVISFNFMTVTHPIRMSIDCGRLQKFT